MDSSRVDTIEQVIQRMHALERSLPENDGVMWFNRLYLSVTEAVGDAAAKGEFAASEFLTRLDVVFAGLYFEAVDASLAAGGRIPKAWAPLFEARKKHGVAPIQFALCGMNAHINHDLPLALVATAKEFGIELDAASAQHKDYLAVNAILKATETRAKKWFATGFAGIVDEAFGNTDDVIAIWNIERARDHAWVTAETLQAIPLKLVREHFLLALARMVAFAGRGLVVSTA